MIDVLANGKIEGDVFYLPPQQLDRKKYEEVKKALAGIGGQWKGGKVQGFVFDNPHWKDDFQRIIGGDKVNLKKDFQFFRTPPSVVNQMREIIEAWNENNPYKCKAVLEPSAGDGAILEMLVDLFPVNDTPSMGKSNDVFAVELNPRMQETLSGFGVEVFCPVDFLTFNDGPFDVIAANPPFTGNQDIKHVRHMESQLVEGGILVSVMSMHFTFATDKESVSFKEWLNNFEHEVIELPAGAFKESGTNVAACLLVIRK